MNITKIELSDFCEYGTTVSVTASDTQGNVETFYVQTVDGTYRSDLGCWVTTNNNCDDINQDDFPSFDVDEVIDRAETFIRSQVEELATDFFINNERAYLLIADKKTEVVTRNSNFINSATSSYQREFSDSVYTADNKDDAIAYLESL